MRNKGIFAVLFGLAVFLSLWRLQDLARFMLDASASQHAIAPTLRDLDDEALERSFFPKHSCFTCYVVALELASEGTENIYNPDHYRDPEHPTEVHEEIGDLLKIDRYQYPPAFLLLPWALVQAGGDFFGARSLFFFLNLGAFALCLWWVQSWLRAPGPGLLAPGKAPAWRPAHIWLTWPLVLLAGNTLTTLQIGNVHAFVMILAILGMLAIRSGYRWLGGALLGFLTVGKIFPGLLLVYLFARGDRRAVAWSVAFALLYALLTFGLFGPETFLAFFSYQLGRLASGEAFSFAFEYPRAMLVNASFTGIAYRLQQLDLLADPERVAKLVTWGMGILLLLLAWICGRIWRHSDSASTGERRHAELGVWLALLLLAQMRSPFLPAGYGSFVVLWLLATLVAAPGGRTSWYLRALLAAPIWYLVATPVPLPFGGSGVRLDFWFGLLGTALALALAGAAMARGRRVLRRAPGEQAT